MDNKYSKMWFSRIVMLSAIVFLSSPFIISCNADVVVEEPGVSDVDISGIEEVEHESGELEEEAIEQIGELINLQASGRVEDGNIVIEGTIDVIEGAYVMVAIERIGSWSLAGQKVTIEVIDGYFKHTTSAYNLGGEGVKIWVSFMFTELIPDASIAKDAFQRSADNYINMLSEEVVKLYGKEGENIIDNRIVGFTVTQ